MSKGLGRKIAIEFTEDILEEMLQVPLLWGNGSLNLHDNIFIVTRDDTLEFTQATTQSGMNNAIYYNEFLLDATNVLEMSVESRMTDRSWISSAIWINDNLEFTSSSDYAWQGISINLQAYTGEISIKFGLFTRNNAGIKGMVEFGNLKFDGNTIIMQESSLSVNKEAFQIQGQEYQYINGPLIDKEYPVISVERYPIESNPPKNRILLLFGNLNTERFSNAVGNLMVKYDATKGNLSGIGGRVESFNVTFLPTDLEAKPNPNPQEIVTINLEAEATLSKIYYTDSESQEESIRLGAKATATLIPVEVVNP